MKDTLDKVLERMGTEVNVSRAYIFEFDHIKRVMSNTHEWVNHTELKTNDLEKGILSEKDNLQDIGIDFLPD